MYSKFPTYMLAAALLFACGSPALVSAQDATKPAQEQAAPEQNAPNRPNLNLTDDQKAQMKKIHENAKSQIDAVNSDSSLSADQKQAKIREIHRDTHKQVEALLTPEQRKTMHEWRREHHGEHQQNPPTN